MNLLGRYLTKIEHEGYENFAKDTDIIVPENFNYGYDIIDEYAKLCPDKRALVWCNDKGEEKIFTFGDMKVLSDKVAYILEERRSQGRFRYDNAQQTLRILDNGYSVPQNRSRASSRYLSSYG